MARKPRRTTLEDVARQAGVSMMTVSRVINHTGRISEATRQRVFEVIEQLDYRPNRAARTLVTSKTFMVALVQPDITNPYFAEMFRGVEDVLRLEDYSVLVADTNETPAREKEILEMLDDTTIDGLLICSSRLPDSDLLPLLERFSCVVATTRTLPERIGSVVHSDYAPGYRAVIGFQYLHEQGYRRIGYLRLQHYDIYVDVTTFQRDLANLGIQLKDEWTRACAPQWQAGYDAGYDLLKAQPELQAIIGGNDLVALGAMRAALDLGRKIPDDLGIIGADDILLASQVTPPMTTLKTNAYAIGSMAAQLLLRRMGGDMTYREHVYTTELIVRGSTGSLLNDNNT
jgi:LacI family transcriptional regulator